LILIFNIFAILIKQDIIFAAYKLEHSRNQVNQHSRQHHPQMYNNYPLEPSIKTSNTTR
jgi:hypothetical protein